MPEEKSPMKTKAEITANWLPRYTGVPVEQMSDYILLTNFNEYLHRFVAMTGGHIVDAGAIGRLDSTSGHGPWPEGLMRFGAFMARL